MTKQPVLYAFKDKDTLISNILIYMQNAQADALKRHGKFKIGISGGSLPANLAKALLGPKAGDSMQWSKWEIFFVDERAVPLDHEDSNYGLLKKELLDKIDPEGPNGFPKVFPIDTEFLDDLQELADTYEKALVSSFAAKDSVKHPIFDLLLMGLWASKFLALSLSSLSPIFTKHTYNPKTR